MKKNEYIAFWGDSLRTIPVDHIAGLQMPQSTESFLVNYGLPMSMEKLQNVLEIRFYFENEQIKLVNVDNEDFIIIGDDGGGFISIERKSGEVHLIMFEPYFKKTFINKDIISFLQFLQLFGKYQQKFQLNGEGNQAYDNLVQTMINEMKSIDSKSFISEETWWSIVTNQP